MVAALDGRRLAKRHGGDDAPRVAGVMDGRDVVALVEHGRLGRKPRAGTASVAVAASEAASERTRDLESVFDDQITPDPETAMWPVLPSIVTVTVRSEPISNLTCSYTGCVPFARNPKGDSCPSCLTRNTETSVGRVARRSAGSAEAVLDEIG